MLSLAWVATINASFAVIVGSPRRKTHGQLTVATKTKTAFSFRNNGLNLVPDGNSSYSNCQRCRLRHKPWSSEYDLRCCIGGIPKETVGGCCIGRKVFAIDVKLNLGDAHIISGGGRDSHTAPDGGTIDRARDLKLTAGSHLHVNPAPVIGEAGFRIA